MGENTETKGSTDDARGQSLVELFTYHASSETDKALYAAINDAALSFARVVLRSTPKGSDQSAAIRMIREARMTANAAIACRGAELLR